MAYIDDLRQIYREEMGRDPSEAEIQDLSRFSGTGHVDLGATEAASIAMGSPRARAEQLQRFGGMYEQNLAGSDSRLLQQAQDQIGSNFAQQGRQSGGSAYVAAFANAARDLAMQRQSQLAGFYGQGYQGIFGEIGQNSRSARDRGYGSLERTREREYEQADYYRQQNDYNDALRGQESRNLRGSLINGAIGLGTSVAGGLAGGFGMAKGLGAVKGAAGAAGGAGGFSGAFGPAAGGYRGAFADTYGNNFGGGYDQFNPGFGVRRGF